MVGKCEVLSFTHGNGWPSLRPIALKTGLPTFLIGDVPLENDIEDDVPIDQPRIYYGENMDGYAIVDTDRDEIDSVEGSTRLAP